MFDRHSFIFLHVGFLLRVEHPALDQEAKISTEMEAMMIFISDTKSLLATLSFFFFFCCVWLLGKKKGKEAGMSKIQRKTVT